MTCVELQESLAEYEIAIGPEQQAHLKNCPGCAALVADLLVIISAASELRGADEPSPRVWNSIEISLRQEGLIRPQRARHSLLSSFGREWGSLRWLVPAAALLLITLGIYVRQRAHTTQVARNTSPVAAQTPTDVAFAGLNDDDLLQEVAQQSPALQAVYSDNLRRVNQYILDAKNIVEAEPDDEDAHRSLMEAYQEKALLFQLALDRSLP